ncbi:MAG TPA: argininosuccinate lyase [Acidimicrobiia bacterium]|nr:argininosuccinate lyase [Acidimicrobiia bacterium]
MTAGSPGDQGPRGPSPNLWGGRFRERPAEEMWRYTVDHADRRLLDIDVEGSIAHVAMLRQVGLLDEGDHSAIAGGLARVLAEAQTGSFTFLDTDEDVHSAVERRLVELVGEVGEKLHTGRSRNDQMALDLRLYLRRSARARGDELGRFAMLLADVAERQVGTLIPSFTHLQQAQVTSLGHHLLAYAWMVLRDRDRLIDLAGRLSSPLGAGASAGSSLPLDPQTTATGLGFGAAFENSLDAVGSRDLVAEFVFDVTQAMVHLSRLSEEMILWASSEFGWVTYPDSHTTGSSALPHKKNPDIAELARGKAAAAIGDLTTLLVLQKGLPLAYNRDLQEDKPPLFRADDALAGTLEALGGMLAGAEFHPPPPGPWTATLDLAEALVKRGMPFRQAHRAVGKLVASLVGTGRSPSQATQADLDAADPGFDPGDLDLLDPATSLARRRTPGSGTPDSVLNQIEKIRSEVRGKGRSQV